MKNLLLSIQTFITQRLKIMAAGNYSGDTLCPGQGSLERFMNLRDPEVGIKEGNARSLEQLLDLYLQQYESDVTGVFAPATVALISGAAGTLCSRCCKPTSYRDPNSPGGLAFNGGILPIVPFHIKHTSAVSFDPETRKFSDEPNGIWLCGDCLHKISNARSKSRWYPPEELKEMKRAHELTISTAAKSSKDLVFILAPGFTGTPGDIRLMHEVMQYMAAQKWLLSSYQRLPGNALVLIGETRSYLKHAGKSTLAKAPSKPILRTIDKIIGLLETTLSSDAGRIKCQYTFKTVQQMTGLYLAMIRRAYHIPIPTAVRKILPPAK